MMKIQIISFLCSESGSHDYTINRREAANELGLKVEKPSQALYELINKTYISISDELELRKPLNPDSYIGNVATRPYTIKRTLIESLAGGTDCFISEGQFARVNIPPIPQNPISQIAIQDQRIFEGWKHYD